MLHIAIRNLNIAMFLNYSNILSLVGILGSIASVLIVLTFLIFKNLRHMRFIEIMFYSAINEFLVSTGVSLGVVNNHSIACWYQGMTNTANAISSLLWITVLSYQLWLIVTFQETIKDMRIFHLVCWIVPWLFCLLSLIDNTFSRIGNS